MNATEVLMMSAGLMGGLAMFLFGMSLMSDSLKNVTGSGLRNLIDRLTKKKLSGYMLGTGITAVVQSSSTTTVMVVGFVNAGIMTLFQAVNVILGANLGTTATAWLLSLNSIDGESLIMTLIKPANFTPFLAVVAVFCTMFTKKQTLKTICNITLGFSLLMMGMSAMSSAMKPLGEMPSFQGLLTSFQNPILGYAVAVVFTLIVQSCDATVGIVQALAMTTGVPYATCIPLICGAQMGTCITSIISSIGGSRNGKRAALLHLFYNIIKTFSFMALFYTINGFVYFPFLSANASLIGIALIHSLINVIYSALLLPMSGVLVKLVYLVLPKAEAEKDIDEIMSILDPVLLKTAAPIAITQAKLVTDKIADLVTGLFEDIRNLVSQPEGKETILPAIRNKFERIDIYGQSLSDYMIKIAKDKLTTKDSKKLMLVKDALDNYSMMSKTFKYALRTIKLKTEKDDFSIPNDTKQELAMLYTASEEVIDIVNEGYKNNNPAFVKAIPAFREVIYEMQDKLARKAVQDMHSGKITYEQESFINEISQCFGHIVGCLDDIGLSMMNAFPNKKGRSNKINEDEMKVIAELFRDKFENFKSA